MSNENGVGPMPDINAEMERASRVLQFAEAELEQKQKHIVKLTQIISDKNEEIDGLKRFIDKLKAALFMRGMSEQEYLDIRMGRAK